MNKLCQFWHKSRPKILKYVENWLDKAHWKAIRRNCWKLQSTSGQLILYNSTILQGKVKQGFSLILIVPDQSVPDLWMWVSTEAQRALLTQPGSTLLYLSDYLWQTCPVCCWWQGSDGRATGSNNTFYTHEKPAVLLSVSLIARPN